MRKLKCFFLALCVLAASPSMGGFAIFTTFATVAGGDPSFVFPLDTWGSSTAAYSFRKLRSAYAGNALQVQRTSDNTTQNIGFLPHGNPDIASLQSFCSFATINASVSGTTLTVNNVLSGALSIGQFLFDATTDGVVQNYYIKQPNKITAGSGVSWTVSVTGTVASERMYATNCFVAKFYDQSGNANDLAQATQSLQPAVIYDGAPISGSAIAPYTGLVVAPSIYNFCQYNSTVCAGTFLKAADSASYKTTKQNLFFVAALGTNRSPLNQPPWAPNGTTAGWFVGYPLTTNSACGFGPGATFPNTVAHPWYFAEQYAIDSYVPNGGSNTSNEQLGFGHTWANYMYPWDVNFDTTSLVFANGVQLSSSTAPSSPITYPNAVGLYVGASSDGNCASTMYYEELILYGTTQASRTSISANQAAYWNITAPPSTFTENGFTFTPQYYSPFRLNGGTSFDACMDSSAPGGPTCYASESMFYPWSLSSAASLATGHDLYRFSVHTNEDDSLGGASPSDRTEVDPNLGWQVTNATSSWNTSSTTISTSCTNGGTCFGNFYQVAAGETVFDMTTGQLIGTIQSYSGTTVTLTTTAAHASSGSADVLFFSVTSPAQGPGAACSGGMTCQISYAVQWQPGYSSPAPNGSVSWNTHGQGHYVLGTFPPAFGGFDLGAGAAGVDVLSFTGDGPSNPTLLWTASNPITRGSWYYVFIEFFVSSSRASPADVLKVWVRGPGIGSGTAYTQILNLGPGQVNPISGGTCTSVCNLYPNSNASGNAGWTYWKIGEYRGNSIGDPTSITGNDVVYYCNLQTSFNKSVRDLSAYVSGNTPPTDCAHP